MERRHRAEKEAHPGAGNSAICRRSGVSDRKLCVPASRRVCQCFRGQL